MFCVLFPPLATIEFPFPYVPDPCSAVQVMLVGEIIAISDLRGFTVNPLSLPAHHIKFETPRLLPGPQ
jgi:hypothetical protein